MLLLPSPKFQMYEVAFVEVLVKLAVDPLTLEVNPALGAPFTVTILGCVNELVLPPIEVTIKVTS